MFGNISPWKTFVGEMFHHGFCTIEMLFTMVFFTMGTCFTMEHVCLGFFSSPPWNLFTMVFSFYHGEMFCHGNLFWGFVCTMVNFFSFFVLHGMFPPWNFFYHGMLFFTNVTFPTMEFPHHGFFHHEICCWGFLKLLCYCQFHPVFLSNLIFLKS